MKCDISPLPHAGRAKEPDVECEADGPSVWVSCVVVQVTFVAASVNLIEYMSYMFWL